MSAAARREELEARLWRSGLGGGTVRILLTVADEYAEAVADERVAGHVNRVTSETATRLTLAHAEAHRKAAKL